MGEIINLRRAKKARERVEKEAAAAENRARFGTSKRVRELTKARSDKENRDLGAKRLDGQNDEES